MVHTTVLLYVNIIVHETKEILEEIDLKQALVDQDFDEYLNHNSITWQDDLNIEEISIIEVQNNHYIFIDINHELSLEALDVVIQQWVLESSYSPYLYNFLGDNSVYLDIIDAIIVNECRIPEKFTHLLKVSILNEQERTFLTEDQRVIKLTPPTITIVGLKDGNNVNPLL